MKTIIAPLLLIIVAARHLVLVNSQDLTTWKGGGFGMFASLDQQRFAKLYVSKENQYFPIHASPDEASREQYRLAMAIPSRKNAIRLAKHIHESNDLPDSRKVVVAVFKTEFARSSPPEIKAVNLRMVASDPSKSNSRLQWKW